MGLRFTGRIEGFGLTLRPAAPPTILPGMDKDLLDKLMKLSPAERVEIAYKLWDSVPVNADATQVTPEQQAEIDRRVAEHEKELRNAIPLEQFVSRHRSRTR